MAGATAWGAAASPASAATISWQGTIAITDVYGHQHSFSFPPAAGGGTSTTVLRHSWTIPASAAVVPDGDGLKEIPVVSYVPLSQSGTVSASGEASDICGGEAFRRFETSSGSLSFAPTGINALGKLERGRQP